MGPVAGAAAAGGAAAGSPIGASTIPVAAGAGAGAVGMNAGGGGGGNHPMVFFMHDILGGTNPSARIVAGIVDNTALTEAPGLGSPAVGRAQGFYIASSEGGGGGGPDGATVAVTAMFKEGKFADSISFFGVHRTADSESHLAIVGGTGKFAGRRDSPRWPS
uniref:Dirigent protein n=1 Tax=Oryza punctata TaxID=4537 RepID=A0A0E0JE79_ORYPU